MPYLALRTNKTLTLSQEVELKTTVGKLITMFPGESREFDSCLQFFTNQIAQNVDYINAFEFFYCQICENKCTNMG